MNSISRHTLCLLSLSLAALISQSAGQPNDHRLINNRDNQTNANSEIGNLIERLFQSKSISEQRDIVAQNQNLISPQMIKALIQKANPVPVSENLEKYESLNRLALGLAQNIGDQNSIAAAVNYLGVIHRKNGNDGLAFSYFNHSFAIYQKLKDKRGISQTLRFYGRLYYQQQNFPEAFRVFNQDLMLANESGEKYYQALARLNLGIALEELEQFELANEEYKQCLEIAQSVTYIPPEGDLNGIIGDALRRAGRNLVANRQFDEAIDSYRKGVEFWQTHPQSISLPQVLNSLSLSLLYDRQLDEAMQTCQKSIAISKGWMLATAYYIEALIHSAQRNHSQAFDSIDRAKALAEKSKDEITLRDVYRAEGIVNHSAGKADIAQTAFNKAISIIERQQARVPLYKETGPVTLGYQYSSYGWMIASLISENRIDEALNFSERVKSRSLLNLLNNPAGKDDFLASQESLKERDRLANLALAKELLLSRVLATVSSSESVIENTRADFYNVKVELEKLSQQIASSADHAADKWSLESAMTRQDIADLLTDEKTALLQFAMSEEQAFLFVATKSGGDVTLKAYPLTVRRHHIRAGVNSFRELIINQDISQEINHISQEWYVKLLKPAEFQLQGKTRLIIVPDGPVWDLPFLALKMPDGRYLVEQYAVSLAPSFNFLRKLGNSISPEKGLAATPSLLAIGNPALKPSQIVAPPGGLMDEKLGDLPSAERQVNEIRKLYGLTNSRVLIGGLATEERFKSLAPAYKILHLAAHGIYNDIDPMRSSIILAQVGKTGKEDGILEARELARLKLNADLVILSACETGRGQIRDGEGIIGLPWALFAAGCPTSVVSQWKVSAESTAELMVSLHNNLKQGNRTIPTSIALQQAAISLLNSKNQKYRHPFFWGGFVVFGKAN